MWVHLLYLLSEVIFQGNLAAKVSSDACFCYFNHPANRYPWMIIQNIINFTFGPRVNINFT
jgi:allantoicase